MKKAAKKLVLSRETVRTLQNETLQEPVGGLTFTDPRVCTTNYTCMPSSVCGDW